MPLLINLRHLEGSDLQLEGDLPVKELDLELHDPMIRVEKPLRYRLEIQKVDDSVLAQGQLRLPLQCECVRCLKPFEYLLDLKGWTALLPLEGEEKAPIISDCVDLTPLVREDILLEFPQHPLCEADCRGLPVKDLGKSKKTSSPGQSKAKSSTWSELDKLKF